VIALAQICDPVMFGDLDPENITHCDYCIAHLRFMMPDIYQLLDSCYYNYIDEPCSEMFKEVITEEGICHTFNQISVYRQQNEKIQNPEWTLDDGYMNDTGEISPRRGSRMGLNLSVLLSNKLLDGGICKDPVQGHKIYIHLPNERPQVLKHYYLAPYQQEVHFFIDPKVIITAPELREFSVSKRQCYFGNERYLRFFKNYTQNNCEEECVANLTLSKCDCLRFHMPSLMIASVNVFL
jgi:acid-sensing ion channel, other